MPVDLKDVTRPPSMRAPAVRAAQGSATGPSIPPLLLAPQGKLEWGNALIVSVARGRENRKFVSTCVLAVLAFVRPRCWADEKRSRSFGRSRSTCRAPDGEHRRHGDGHRALVDGRGHWAEMLMTTLKEKGSMPSTR
jgi:hypothetical protein